MRLRGDFKEKVEFIRKSEAIDCPARLSRNKIDVLRNSNLRTELRTHNLTKVT